MPLKREWGGAGRGERGSANEGIANRSDVKVPDNMATKQYGQHCLVALF